MCVHSGLGRIRIVTSWPTGQHIYIYIWRERERERERLQEGPHLEKLDEYTICYILFGGQIFLLMYLYIYIYIERERERGIYINNICIYMIYIYIYIYIYIIYIYIYMTKYQNVLPPPLLPKLFVSAI